MVTENNKNHEWSKSEEVFITPSSSNMESADEYATVQSGLNSVDYSKHGNSCDIDLGKDYINRMQETMEEWYSKPRKGSHVTDVVMCPRQRVYREIDRLPIDAKTVSIYSAGKAIHEAIQLLFLSDIRTGEIRRVRRHTGLSRHL